MNWTGTLWRLARQPVLVLGVSLFASVALAQAPPKEDASVRGPTARFDLATGYFHAWGRFSERQTPGFALDARMMIQWADLALGLDLVFLGGETNPDQRIVLESTAADNPTSKPLALRGSPTGMSVGFVVDQVAYFRGPWLLTSGCRLGYLYQSIHRSSREEGVKYAGYGRPRHGIMAGYHAGATWFFYRDSSQQVGLTLRVGLNLSQSWASREVQVDLGSRDTSSYGLEWWPAFTLGITGLVDGPV